MSRRPLMAGELLELAARPCLNPASILWPAWPEEAAAQRRPRSRRAEAPLWFFNAPELNGDREGD